MKKKGIVFLVIGLIITLSFAQEGRKGIQIKETKGNAGKRWAICIGINDYEDKTILDLKKARNDASELGKILEEYGQFDHVYVMTDDLDAKKENYPKLRNIKNKLKYLEGFIDPEDLVLFSFSGHGIANPKGEGFLVMADSYREDFQGSSLKVKDIIEWLKEIEVKKSLLLLDACREQFQEGKAMNLNGLKAERFLRAEVGAVFYSTKSGWFSYEDEEGDFGVFTRYVIDGLKGGADDTKIAGNGDGIVTFSELVSFVEKGVSNWALNKGKKQRPYTGIFSEKYGDLALSVYILDDKPADVKALESKAKRIYKNDKGFWEAEYEDGIVMVYIPASEFTMGSNDGRDNEKPPHKVQLEGYWIGKYEVNFDQYDKYCEKTNKKKPSDRDWGRGKRPVIDVSWNDANEYCKWLSQKIGLKFKLPTEAQWEKAARGSDGRKYPWGNSPPSGKKVNFADTQVWLQEKYRWADKGIDDGYAYTAPVESYPQGTSPYGILNMAGNVWEWCNDWYDSD